MSQRGLRGARVIPLQFEHSPREPGGGRHRVPLGHVPERGDRHVWPATIARDLGTQEPVVHCRRGEPFQSSSHHRLHTPRQRRLASGPAGRLHTSALLI